MGQTPPKPGATPGTGHIDQMPRWYQIQARSANSYEQLLRARRGPQPVGYGNVPNQLTSTSPYLTPSERLNLMVDDQSRPGYGRPSSAPQGATPATATPRSGQIVQQVRQTIQSGSTLLQRGGAQLGAGIGVLSEVAAIYDTGRDLVLTQEMFAIQRQANDRGYYTESEQQRLGYIYNSTGGFGGAMGRWLGDQVRNSLNLPQPYSREFFERQQQSAGGSGGGSTAAPNRSPFTIPGIPPPGQPDGGRDPRQQSPPGGAFPGGGFGGAAGLLAPAPGKNPTKRPGSPDAPGAAAPFNRPGSATPGSQPDPSPYGDSVMGSTPPFLGGQCPTLYIVNVDFKSLHYNNFTNRWVTSTGRITFDGWGPFSNFKPYPRKRNGGWGYHFTYNYHGRSDSGRLADPIEYYGLDHGNPYPIESFELTNIEIYPGTVRWGRSPHVPDNCGNPKPENPPTPLNRRSPRHRLIIDPLSPFNPPAPAVPNAPPAPDEEPQPQTDDPDERERERRKIGTGTGAPDRSGSPQPGQPGGGGPESNPSGPAGGQPKGTPAAGKPTNGSPAGTSPTATGGSSTGSGAQELKSPTGIPQIPKPELPHIAIPFVGFAPVYPPGTVQWQSWNPDPLPTGTTPPKEVTDTISDSKPKTDPKNDPKKSPITPTPTPPTPIGTCRYTPFYDQQNLALSQKMDLVLNVVQTVQLAGIDSKLGPQVSGGLSGFATKTWSTIRRMYNFLQIDRVLNILTWIGVMHNAFMLSNNIAQTLFSGIDNILNLFGIKGVNDEGQEEEINTGQIISEWTANFFKLIFGAENYTNMVATWKRLNRIYQAAANILYSFQSIGYSILDSMEVVGNYVAKIGNAAKEAGVVLEKAYSWMNPRNNFTTNRFFRGLNVAQDAVDAFEEVSSSAVDIKENIDQLKSESKKLSDELSSGEGAEAAQRSEAKAKSAATAVSPSDLNKPEDSQNDS